VVPLWVSNLLDDECVASTNTFMSACPHVVGVACCILSDPKVVDKSPFNVMSELLILADKNRISGLTGRKMKTIDAVLQLL
jgi:hypothetical protein